jgi:histidine ammonia-lyase
MPRFDEFDQTGAFLFDQLALALANHGHHLARRIAVLGQCARRIDELADFGQGSCRR